MGKGGGGGQTQAAAGGGSSSGTIDYPGYMKTTHQNWLTSVDSQMSTAMAGNSPFNGWSTVDVATSYGALAAGNVPFTLYNTLAGTDFDTEFDNYYTAVMAKFPASWLTGYVDSAYVCAAVQAEATCVRHVVDRDIRPKFLAGMRDLNAVQSSSFVIGEAMIEEEFLDKVIESDRKMRLTQQMTDAELGYKYNVLRHELVKYGESNALARTNTLVELRRMLTTLSAELTRQYVTARTTEDKLEVEMDARDRMFDLDVFQYGCQVMACISGAAVGKDIGASVGQGTSAHMSPMSSIVNYAAQGAMIGSMVPGASPTTAGIGAAIGGGFGLLSSLFG